MKKIFIVEDDRNISSIIAFNLKAQGFEVLQEYDGRAGLEGILAQKPDLAVLDLMLPTLDGFEVLTELRKVTDLPVIILSARTDEQDKLRGLSLMADDYITKPFSVNELVARIKVNLARYEGTFMQKNTVTVDSLELDPRSMSVTREGENVSVSKKEFEILLLLATNKGAVVSREQILEKVWGYSGYLGDLHTVDVAIGRLRAKIEKYPAQPQIILSRRGAGYYIP